MKTVILDGVIHRTPADVYDHLARVFDFGPYFGRNPDALYDFLVPLAPEEMPVRLIWRNSGMFRQQFGEVFAQLQQVFDHVRRYYKCDDDCFTWNAES